MYKNGKQPHTFKSKSTQSKEIYNIATFFFFFFFLYRNLVILDRKPQPARVDLQVLKLISQSQERFPLMVLCNFKGKERKRKKI